MRRSKTFWAGIDENGYYWIGPHKSGDGSKEMPEDAMPKLKEGETVRARIVVEEAPK